MMTMPRVLLVDDDYKQLKLNAIRLREANFEVDTALGGEAALVKAKSNPPDVIMSDVLMDDLDGFGLCRRLRSDPTFAAVPIILLSAHYQNEPDQTLARHVGAATLVSRTPDFADELRALSMYITSVPPAAEQFDASIYEAHLRTNAHQMTKLLGRVREIEGLYRSLFDHAHDTISIVTPDGYILDANERWRSILGMGPETLVGRHIREFAAAGHEDANVAAFNKLGNGGRGATALATADGRIIYMEFANSLIEIDGKSLILSIGREVTEQVLAAQQLAAAEARLRALVHRIPDMLWTADLDGKLTFATANCEPIFGETIEELLAQDFETRAERLHPADRAMVISAYRAFLENGTPFDIEYRRRRGDGEWLWIRNRTIGRYTHDGVDYVEGMITDITERKRLEEIVRQSQKMEAIGQLTGGIAHDFNNILAVIVANSQLLADDLGEHDPRREYAEDIFAAGERAAALTRQLLAFSRRQRLEPKITRLSSIVGNLEKMLRRLISEDIELSVSGHDVNAVRVDVGQIEQVLMNLVVNARDAMPTGGKLAIATSDVVLNAHAAAGIGAAPGNYVLLSVRDSGCGMTAEVKRRMFEPFYTTKELGKGTGLGLSTCYGIVQQSGGHIAVQSEVGHGSVFEIYLPCAEANEPQVSRRDSRIVLGGTERILVIEDDDSVRTTIRRMLEPRGYRLLFARGAAEAAVIADGQQIDLVLSDVVMPGLSGPATIQEIEKNRGRVRTLYMSGYSDHPMLRGGEFERGVNFIQKPFTSDVLAKKIREALDVVL